MATSAELLAKRKRRSFGEVKQRQEVRCEHAWVSIHPSSKELLMTYESEGLVVCINGSGSLEQTHVQSEEAGLLAQEVVKRGGVVLNGGRKTGIMGSTTKAAKGAVLGVVHEQIATANEQAGVPKIVVSKSSSRNELLATCAPVIVIFQGGLGSTQQLIRAIVHVNNVQQEDDQLSHLLFVSTYWYPLLETLVNMGSIPREFLKDVFFFHRYEEVVEHLPS